MTEPSDLDLSRRLSHPVRQLRLAERRSRTVPPPVSCPGRKFIDGLPMNPATNRLAGCS